MNLLPDKDFRSRLTPVQSMFAQIIERMDSTVQQVAVKQAAKSSTDKTQTQEISSLHNSLNSIRYDLDQLKRFCEREEYDQSNLERTVQQMRNDNQNLERRLNQLERKK